MFRWFVALAFALLSFATACSRGDARVAQQQASAAVAVAPPIQPPRGDASPVGGSIEDIRRNDGTVSRFDRAIGAFLAFNRDGTIRTFFKPNDGEAYFRRQAPRVH